MNMMVGPLRPPATVATPSAERDAMQDDLDLIADIRAGLPAMRARSARYLPRYEAEGQEEHRRRVASAPWRPEFADVLLTLASKPFSKPVTLPDGTPEPILHFAEDVDGRGNNLHVFSRKLFVDAMANGVSLVVIDFPNVPTPARTIADEKASPARPYWMHYHAASVIACRTDLIAGRERIVHLRLRENVIEPDGAWGETHIEQVRVLEPGRWQVWRKKPQPAQFVAAEEWEVFAEGEFAPADDGVKAVLVFTGERLGDIQTRPPLRDLADMQIELYRALSRQDEILTYAGSPMLSANGVAPPENARGVEIGPKRLLFAPANSEGKFGHWSYVQPDAANLREIREHVASIIEDMQRLGLQPMIARDGDVSATEFAITSAKAHSALEAWALNLKDALEQAFALTVPWLKTEERAAIGATPIAVNVHTDFSADMQISTEASVLLGAEKERVISKRTARDGLARRGLLGPAYDAKAEEARLANAE